MEDAKLGRGARALVNGEGNAALIVKTVPPQADNSHEEIIRNAVKPDSGRVERRSFNGLPAIHFSGTRKNEEGRSQRVELTLVTGPLNRNYAFIYAAKDHVLSVSAEQFCHPIH